MTRTDYEKFADAIAESMNAEDHHVVKTSKLIGKLTKIFEDDNPNFKATYFMEKVVGIYHSREDVKSILEAEVK